MLKNNKDFKTTHCYFYKNVKNKTTTIGKINFLRELILTLRFKKVRSLFMFNSGFDSY